MDIEVDQSEKKEIKVVAPSLEELKTRPCTLEELQAALIKFIELYNEQGKVMNAAINGKQDRKWRATI